MPSSSTQEYSRTLEPTFRLSTSAVCRSLCHVSAQELDSLAGFEAGCCECRGVRVGTLVVLQEVVQARALVFPQYGFAETFVAARHVNCFGQAEPVPPPASAPAASHAEAKGPFRKESFLQLSIRFV